MTDVALIRDASDPVASSIPVGRAVERLRSALEERGVRVERADPSEDGVATVTIAGRSSGALAKGAFTEPDHAEAFAIASERSDRVRTTAIGADVRGLVYAVLELADRVEHGADPLRAIRVDEPVLARPANEVRSVTRLFCSDVEDLGWFRDEGFWRRYLRMLVAQRFNRFSLTLGLGYNFHRGVTDAYLYFAYPFLLSVPGYDVRVPQLPEDERERNLAALRFLTEEADAVGLDVQLGLWTHAYGWIDSPNAHQTIEGLTPETHAAYCRDAVTALLEACPRIGGLTFRVHGEGGIPEGSWAFWRTVFDGVVAGGRGLGIDLHAKGLDQPTLDAALDTGLPVTVSPKFWAEHMGLPYHQAAIRESERVPRADPNDVSHWHSYMRVSEGSRPFTRYGYGDFLREDRPYGIVFRLWAGTQRLLLWGDPAFAASYGRAGSLAGSQGIEWCEPLTFKGREGTGLPASRTGYADPSLEPRDDWEKYAYTYRLFGRLTYDPDAPAQEQARALPSAFGDGADAAGSALANASRILPLVTTAHHPSASNNYFWPEIYTDMPIVTDEDEEQTHPYRDTPTPRRFGTVDPLDPEVFCSVVAYVEDLIAGRPHLRVTPMDVAAALDELSGLATRDLEAAEGSLGSAEGRRWASDVRIQSALGRFFAAKTRAAVGFEIHRRTADTHALHEAARQARVARDAWADAVDDAVVYVPDLTFGPQAWLRGHWRDRLEAIERDVDALERLAEDAGRSPARSIEPAPSPPRPDGLELRHDTPAFRHVSPTSIEIAVTGPGASRVASVRLRYRPMDQSRAWLEAEMDAEAGRYVAVLPASATEDPYPLAYAFVVEASDGGAWRHPDLGESLAGTPYFVAVRGQG